MFSFVMKQSENHRRNSYLRYSTPEMHESRITRLEKNLEKIKSSFCKNMQVLQRKVKTQERMFNEMEDERDLVVEHLKAKEDIYATIKCELDVSKQQLGDIEKEREKIIADLYHFSSNQQMKTVDILATLATSGLIRSPKKSSAWKRVKLFFQSKLRRRETREETLSNHVERACYYLSEVTTVLENLFSLYSDITRIYLSVGDSEKKNDVKKDTSERCTFFDDALLRSSAYEKLTQMKHDENKYIVENYLAIDWDLPLSTEINTFGQFSQVVCNEPNFK